jgi:hypothetical protein
MKHPYRQWYVGVFRSQRATDLVIVFGVVAANRGDAIQQAWDYVRAQWRTDPRALEYVPVPLPLIRERQDRRRARDDQA